MRARSVICAALLAGAAACAQDVPGSAPPADRLHFPYGMAFVPGATPDRDVLVVGNSNFDQRYNAGSLTSLNVDRLVALLPPPAETAPAFIADFPEQVIVDRVRIYQFNAEVVAAKVAEPAKYAVFTASRGRNRVTMAFVEDGQLTCSNEGRETIPGLDCTEGFVLRTFGPDPFPLAYSPEAGVLAIGHLRAEQETESSPITSAISMVRPEDFLQRVELERMNMDFDAAQIVANADIPGLGGTTGLMFLPGAAGDAATLVAAGRRPPVADFPVGVTTYTVERDGEAPSLTEGAALSLLGRANVFDMRGLVVTATAPAAGASLPARAYATVRFRGVGDVGTSATSGGIAVVGVDDADGLQLLSTLEVGDELGRPFLLERMRGNGVRRLLYIPDTRTDSISVVDVSTDSPLLVATISARFERTDADGAPFLAHTLDAPSTILFLERGGRQLAFVTNFSNSTLSALDLTSDDPTEHRVIARFGRAVTPSQSTEEPGQPQ